MYEQHRSREGGNLLAKVFFLSESNLEVDSDIGVVVVKAIVVFLVLDCHHLAVVQDEKSTSQGLTFTVDGN